MNQRGEGVIEYSLILILVAVVIIVILVLLSPAIADIMKKIMGGT